MSIKALIAFSFREISSAGRLVSIVSLVFFVVLAVSVTYPIAVRLGEFSVLHPFTDDLLEAWTLKWDVHSILAGPTAARKIWDANIFYPYPYTLAFTEHLLATALLLLPVTLLGSTPLVATNVGVILTTVLTGWGTYLLVTWLTGNRWAGLVAGVAFAIAPYRLGHITQLHLLSTHWIPFIFLAMARLIKSKRTADLILLLLFTNLQFFSVINYAPLVVLALGIWMICYLLVYRNRTSVALLVRLFIFGAVTLALNWPVLRIYQQVSDRMDIVRTLGDAKIYGASIINYVLPMGNSLLYGRWLGLPTHIDYLFPGIGIFVSTFPGVMVLLLAVVGVPVAFKVSANRNLRTGTLAVLVMVVVGFLLSFGANDEAFGQSAASIIGPLLPYPYLYDVAPILAGLRVPIRFALLSTFGLALLAGVGFAQLGRLWGSRHSSSLMAAALIGAITVLEHFPAPLPGVSIPHSELGYEWLAKNTAADAVVLELPYYLHTKRSNEEVLREYQSTTHWRKLVNGSSGFKPEWLVELGTILDHFPDWRSFDVIRQLGVDYVLLHSDQYEPTAWNNLIALLPGYLPAVEAIHTVGDDMILQLSPPECHSDGAQVWADASAFPVINISNDGPVTWVADPQIASEVRIGHSRKEFLEPLFVLPGQTVKMHLTVKPRSGFANWQVQLGNLEQTLTTDTLSNRQQAISSTTTSSWQPVEIPFANQAILSAMNIGDSTAACGHLNLSLRWTFASYADETVRVELIDKFDRLTLSNEANPVPEAEVFVSTHVLPLAETIPPGRYQLQIRLLSHDETEINAVDSNGSPINQIISMPVVIHPPSSNKTFSGQGEKFYFANKAILLGVDGIQSEVKSGDWLRFALAWQGRETIAADYTVFTQLLGPDGQLWGQHDNPPKGGWYPTSLWTAREVVVDDYTLQVDPTAPEGEYHLIVGMYDSVTGRRVGVKAGPGKDNSFVEVATIMVFNP